VDRREDIVDVTPGGKAGGHLDDGAAAGPLSSPRATSGAMNTGVPSIGRSQSAVLENPKSASLARPSAPTTTFLALTCPCTSECQWR
jgi:hypothetical protein